MDIERYLENIKHFQDYILKFINDESDCNKDFQNIIQFLDQHNILSQKNEIKLILNFLNEISNNHHRTHNFFDKIEQILSLFTSQMKNLFTKTEIYKIFQNNRRILLFLLKEKIVEKQNYYSRENYNEDFAFYINISDEVTEKGIERRNNGENHNHICELIRNDSIEEFIIYINQKNISIDSSIIDSAFETNSFLLDKHPKLIEYAAFYGSIQIFNYLKQKYANLEESLWIYAIHSNNPEMIYLLEESEVNMNIEECFEEIIKCHHNDILEYFQINYSSKQFQSQKKDTLFKIKYYNFQLSKNEINDLLSFNYLCIYDYCNLVSLLLEIGNIDFNELIFKKLLFLNIVYNFYIS